MPKVLEFDLDPIEFARAEAEACRRQQYNESKQIKGRNKAPKSGDEALRIHRLGCIGEMAVAKFLGVEDSVFTETTPVRGSSDLPGNIDVKTRAKHGYDLLVQIDDDPNKVFFLVTYDEKTIKLCGWIKGRYAMRSEWIREYVRGRPCYSVPQKALNDPETLPERFLIDINEPRIIGRSDVWISECENGDLLVNFSDNVLTELGWHEGDELLFEPDKDGVAVIIRKIN